MPRPRLVPLERRTLKETHALQRHLAHSKPEAVDASRRLLHLCKAADLSYEPLYEGPALERALWRYEALWLPLMLAVSPAHAGATVRHCPAFARVVDELRAKNQAPGGIRLTRADLVPPLDVAWVWHCHRLSPRVYADDIAALTDPPAPLDTTFDDAFRFSDGQDAQSKRVRMVWKNAFPTEPFLPKYILSRSWEDEEKARRESISAYASELLRANFRAAISARVISRVASAQRVFLWQVVGQPGDDPAPPAHEMLIETNEYLARAYDRYLLFVALHRRVTPASLLVPMNDINIVWHAHLSCSFEYKRETYSIVGRLLDHDIVSVEDRRSKRVERLRVDAFEAAASHTASAVQSHPISVHGSDAGLAATASTSTANGHSSSSDRDGGAAGGGAGGGGGDGSGGNTGSNRDADGAADGPYEELGRIGQHATAMNRSSLNGPRLVPPVAPRGEIEPVAINEDVGEGDVESLGLPSVELAEMDDEEIEALVEKRRRGISVRETKMLWESTYGSSPKYDISDTCYRGEPDGDRGGFYAVFEKSNGTSHDISWVRAFFLMVAASSVVLCGLAVASWAFFNTMLKHGKYFVGVPAGLAVAGLGVYMFLAIPINRPLSSDAPFWIDRNLKQTHNPLPPYLISSTKKFM